MNKWLIINHNVKFGDWTQRKDGQLNLQQQHWMVYVTCDMKHNIQKSVLECTADNYK